MLAKKAQLTVRLVVWIAIVLTAWGAFLSTPAVAYGFETPDKGVVQDKAETMLEMALSSKDYEEKYGMPSIDESSNVLLGDPIPVYFEYDGELAYAEECIWPILLDDEVVANVSTVNNDDGTTSFVFRADFCQELNVFEGVRSSCAVFIDEEGNVFAFTPDGDFALIGYALDAGEIVDASVDETVAGALLEMAEYGSPMEDLQELLTDEAIGEVAPDEVDLEEGDEGPDPLDGAASLNGLTVHLAVPLMQQQGGSCWATSVASIGNYLTDETWDFYYVCNQLGIGLNDGGNGDDAVDGLALFHYTSATPLHAETASVLHDDDTIKNWLNSGMPIYARLHCDPNRGHAVVICGWGNDEDDGFYVEIMNPGIATQYRLMTKSGSGVLQTWYNSSYFGWTTGSVILTGWQKPYGGSQWAYYNTNGTRKTGLYTSGAGYTYYFDPSNGNYMATGWKGVGGYWYYFDTTSGKALTGWQVINGKEYSFAPDGKMRTEWYTSGAGYTYYLDPDDGGAMVTGWKGIGGYWYYFNSIGQMQKGWQAIGGETYYLGTDGRMVTGWQQVGSKWYFFDSSGKLQTGWHQSVNSDWFYLDPDDGGAMVTGWKKVSGYWYHFDSDGKMQTGWQQVGSYWYFLQSSGKMKTGWHQSVAGDWYYLRTAKDVPVTGPEGAMLASVTVSIDGTSRTFNSSGKCTNTSGL